MPWVVIFRELASDPLKIDSQLTVFVHVYVKLPVRKNLLRTTCHHDRR